MNKNKERDNEFENDYLMDRQDIMKYMKCGSTYFSKLVRNSRYNGFPVFKVGREWRCRHSKLLAWCDEQIENR